MERGKALGMRIDASRRRAVESILALAIGAFGAARAAAQPAIATRRGSGRAPIPRSVTLPLASDLAADGRASRAGRLPILLFFDREECPYCERALREYLVPMSREEWRERAIFRRIEIDRERPLAGFDGAPTTHARLAARFDVSLSPTVIVVDAGGNTLSEPIVGLLTVDFYGAHLDRALEEAAAKLGR